VRVQGRLPGRVRGTAPRHTRQPLVLGHRATGPCPAAGVPRAGVPRRVDADGRHEGRARPRRAGDGEPDRPHVVGAVGPAPRHPRGVDGGRRADDVRRRRADDAVHRLRAGDRPGERGRPGADRRGRRRLPSLVARPRGTLP
jgi:hypothetical protein